MSDRGPNLQTKASPRTLIAGAGALGSVFGGFLRRDGLEVTLLGRPGHLDAIAVNGLRIEGIWGNHVVHGFHLCTSARRLTGPFDAILITVKSFDTAAMTESVAPLLSPDGVMISLQNGLGNVETLEACAGPERVLGARVIFGAVVAEPGTVRVTVSADPTAIGAREPGRHALRDARAREWAARFDRAGVPAVYTENLVSLLWAKAFYNAALNPLGALLRVHYGMLPEHSDSRALMDSVIDEAFAVARADGVDLPWPDASAYREEFYGRLVPSTFDHRSSMLQDLERGRRTEIDAINGEVWRRGTRRGVATPVNETLTRLIHLAEERFSADE